MLDIWTFDLKNISQETERFVGSLLSPDEKARSKRYALWEKGRDFALARGIARHVLSGYVATPARDLVFTLSSHGKPQLATHNVQAPFFNLSHSRSYVCLAISPNRRVGVDIEVKDKDVQRLDKIASFAFSAPEVHALSTYPETSRRNAFYTLWTAKEAYVKGTGEGLTRLRNISCRIRCAWRSLIVQGINGDDNWRLHHFQPWPHVQGTAAMEGNGSVLIVHRNAPTAWRMM
ncbi:MAG: 4'-phosphopantetheinyl transferase superfamily protein [Desulfovermiculus sp.]